MILHIHSCIVENAFTKSFPEKLFTLPPSTLRFLTSFLFFFASLSISVFFFPTKRSISFYYEFSKEQDYICSKPEDSGMHLCSNLPPYRIGPLVCNGEYCHAVSYGLSWG